MRILHSAVRRGLGACWRASAPLTVAAGLFVPLVLLAGLGLVVDGRRITEGPVWLKPAKFAISSGVYCLTLAAVFARAGRTSRLMGLAGWVIAVSLVLEVGIVDFQAVRGIKSHFNVSSPLNASLWAAMGLGILALLAASLAVTAELFRLPIADPAWAWMLRLGMLVTVLGSMTGGLMTQPTARQLAAAGAAGGTMPTVGAHTVGGPDGGPGMPLTGWSRDHGDLRVAHFCGLHAIQAIPLLAVLGAWGLRLRSGRGRLALVAVVAASYAGLIVLLTVQALGGRPTLGGDPASLRHLDFWAAATLLGVAAVLVQDRSRVGQPSMAMGG